MKSVEIYFLAFVLSSSLIYSQSYDMLKNYESGNKIFYNYQYNEFDQYAYKDSSIVLTSFEGQQNIKIDSVISFLSDITKYYLTIEKIGKEVKRNFYDTLSIENVQKYSKYIINQNNAINEPCGEKHIYGWIFPDSLLESMLGLWDPFIYYPYTRLFRYYTQSNHTLYIMDDTLAIQYLPKIVNYSDSRFGQTYFLDKYKGLVYYSRYYSYFGIGFFESMKYDRVTTVKQNIPISEHLYLYQNYPNPFNPVTNIKFVLNKSTNVKLIVYDILGRVVEKLLDEHKSTGIYEIQFNGSRYSSGVYFYCLTSDESVITKKFVLLK